MVQFHVQAPILNLKRLKAANEIAADLNDKPVIAVNALNNLSDNSS